MANLINALSTGASLASFLLSIHLLLRDRKEGSKRFAWGYFAFFIFCSALLFYSSYHFKQEISTLTQNGDFGSATNSVKEVFYPIPYRSKPYLTVRVKERGRRGNFQVDGGVVDVVEQRPDGFKLDASRGFADKWEWQAEGIQIEK